jgi:REP element-mobilizing transposase RayT
MSRPLRIEFPGAVHHVTSRGNAGREIFTDAADGTRFVELLAREVRQQRWLCHAFCLMGDHYHLLVETPEANLARGMGRLNMTYAQWFNRRHACSGHLFGDRYRTVNVEPGEALLLLARHVVLNPVRRGLVRHARQWRWSSYHATALGTGPDWACGEGVLAGFAAARGGARAAYTSFVDAGSGAPSPWRGLRAGQYLGSEAFLKDMQERVKTLAADQVPSSLLHPGRPTADQILTAVAGAARVPAEDVLDRRAAREAFRVAVFLLRRAANLPLARVAAMANVSPGRVSQIQRAVDDAGGLGRAFPWAAALAERYEV